jgi:hypothetical protein
MKTTFILTILICLFSCKSNEKKALSTNELKSGLVKESDTFLDRFEFKNKDSLTFRDLKYDRNLNKYNLTELDRNEILNWTNKFMPKGLIEMRLYSAHYYSFQDETNNYKLFTIFTLADDWTKMHFITVNNENKLIGEIEIGEDLSYLMEQDKDKEIYAEETSYAVKISNNSYKVFKKTETTFNYFSERKDSVIMDIKSFLVEINKDGQIIKRTN